MKEILIGLIAAPELPEKIVNDIVDELPQIFSKHIDNNINWKIEIEINPLTGAAETQQEISDEARSIMQRKNWDYTLCLTDLPLFSQKEIVLADINYQRKIARISLPSFGFTPMRHRVKKTMIEIIGDLYYQGLKKEQYSKEQDKSDVVKNDEDRIKKHFRFSPIRRIISPDGMNDNDVRYIVIPRINGRLRLLLGMTHANRPWTIVSSFKPIIAVAFATGAYVLIFPTLWKLSVSYTLSRLIGLMLVAIISMVLWMIVSHHLWEKKTVKSMKNIRRLYNYATIMTLTIAVCSYYLMLFIIFLIAIVFFVPPDLFSSTANIEGSVELKSFVNLAWLATSVATLAGSIGASSENEELVRNVAYGYRQNRRYQEMNQTKQNK